MDNMQSDDVRMWSEISPNQVFSPFKKHQFSFGQGRKYDFDFEMKKSELLKQEKTTTTSRGAEVLSLASLSSAAVMLSQRTRDDGGGGDEQSSSSSIVSLASVIVDEAIEAALRVIAQHEQQKIAQQPQQQQQAVQSDTAAAQTTSSPSQPERAPSVSTLLAPVLIRRVVVNAILSALCGDVSTAVLALFCYVFQPAEQLYERFHQSAPLYDEQQVAALTSDDYDYSFDAADLTDGPVSRSCDVSVSVSRDNIMFMLKKTFK